MRVYFKESTKWRRGPIIMHLVDGRKVYTTRAGKRPTLNRNYIVHVKPKEEAIEEVPLVSAPANVAIFGVSGPCLLYCIMVSANIVSSSRHCLKKGNYSKTLHLCCTSYKHINEEYAYGKT